MYCPIVKMAHLMQLVHSAIANRENGGKKTAYNNYSVDVAEMLGFITEVQGQIDGIFWNVTVIKMFRFVVL